MCTSICMSSVFYLTFKYPGSSIQMVDSSFPKNNINKNKKLSLFSYTDTNNNIYLQTFTQIHQLFYSNIPHLLTEINLNNLKLQS